MGVGGRMKVCTEEMGKEHIQIMAARSITGLCNVVHRLDGERKTKKRI